MAELKWFSFFPNIDGIYWCKDGEGAFIVLLENEEFYVLGDECPIKKRFFSKNVKWYGPINEPSDG